MSKRGSTSIVHKGFSFVFRTENLTIEVVKAGNFQAAATMGDYSLVGCTVAPGFDFEDFSFIEEPSMQEWIKVAHPDLTRFI